MTTCFYGGSFNPPHLGHVAAAEAVAAALQPERFLIIPDRVPPHKEMAEGSPTPQQRLELCRLAFASVPDAEVTDLELLREGRSYSVDTVAALREQYLEDELVLVLGSDMLLGFELWFRFEEILRECTLAALSRVGNDTEELQQCAQTLREKYGARICFVEHSPVVISSSEIRDALRQGSGQEYLTPGEWAYIRENGLYGV